MGVELPHQAAESTIVTVGMLTVNVGEPRVNPLKKPLI
jgi:hypothetical protein